MKIHVIFEDKIELQVFVLDLRPVKQYLLQNAVSARERLFGSRIEDWTIRNSEFISRFEQFEERMSKCPTTVEEYSEVVESIADLDRSLPELIAEIDLNNQVGQQSTNRHQIDLFGRFSSYCTSTDI